METERPHSIELERALLGGLILRPHMFVAVLKLVTVRDFYRSEHAAIFALLCEMHVDGIPVEPITVQERALRGGHIDRYGGIAAVVELPDHAGDHLDYYARRVAALARWRAVMDAADLLYDAAAQASSSVENGVDVAFDNAAGALAALAPLASPEARARALTGLAVAAGRDAAVAAFRAAFPKGGV